MRSPRRSSAVLPMYAAHDWFSAWKVQLTAMPVQLIKQKHRFVLFWHWKHSSCPSFWSSFWGLDCCSGLVKRAQPDLGELLPFTTSHSLWTRTVLASCWINAFFSMAMVFWHERTREFGRDWQPFGSTQNRVRHKSMRSSLLRCVTVYLIQDESDKTKQCVTVLRVGKSQVQPISQQEKQHLLASWKQTRLHGVSTHSSTGLHDFWQTQQAESVRLHVAHAKKAYRWLLLSLTRKMKLLQSYRRWFLCHDQLFLFSCPRRADSLVNNSVLTVIPCPFCFCRCLCAEQQCTG